MPHPAERWSVSCWISSTLSVAASSSRSPSSTRPPATAFKEQIMIVDYILGGAVTLGLLVYLAYALIRPERF